MSYLTQGRVDHWPRKDAFRKNWLQTGRMTACAVRDLLLRCRGKQYRASALDVEPETTVHEFFPEDRDTRWYIKVFFDEEKDAATFISVHPSGE